jgi:hypothetical protein
MRGDQGPQLGSPTGPTQLTSVSRCKSVLCAVSSWTSRPSGELPEGGMEQLPSSSLDCDMGVSSESLTCCPFRLSLS